MLLKIKRLEEDSKGAFGVDLWLGMTSNCLYALSRQVKFNEKEFRVISSVPGVYVLVVLTLWRMC